MSLPVSFFFKTILVLLGPSHFHKNVRAIISILTKNKTYKEPAGILNENMLSLYINLGKINILTILNFPVHENRLSPFMQISHIFVLFHILLPFRLLEYCVEFSLKVTVGPY